MKFQVKWFLSAAEAYTIELEWLHNLGKTSALDMLLYDSGGGAFVFSCCLKQPDRYITGAAVFPCRKSTGPSQSPCTGLDLERLAHFWQASACSVLMIVFGQAPISTLFVAFMLFIFTAFAVRENGAIWRHLEKCELAGWIKFLCFSVVFLPPFLHWVPVQSYFFL